MVAISLYRGNMHRIPPDVHRRWLMPSSRISFKHFRLLHRRRSKALSLLPSSSSAAFQNPSSSPPDDFIASENLNFSPPLPLEVTKVENDAEIEAKKSPSLSPLNEELKVEDVVEKERENGDAVVGGDIPALEDNDKSDNPADKEKRRGEVEEKLKILNERKHNLVKALKQILNAEEELKRRSCVQAGRPPLPVQPDASNDSGSMTRHATPRTGSEANATVDMEGGEGDEALNPNPQSRPLPHINNTSPSAESALRRAPYFHHTAASLPSRAAIVAAGSPSRFAPSGNQVQPSNLPSVSVSGTNYIASSPSPAASGGTSGFRDARHPSPWN